jgi:glycosyltransferase involved in cell wall biosynthesis
MNLDLSILICTRNGIKTIAEAISCCEKEVISSDKNVEILVVDNGSTDGTHEFLQSKALNSKVTIRLYQEKKPGKIHAFERGVREARADLVTIIDDDNYIEKDFIYYTLKIFQDYRGIGIIGSQNKLIESLSPPDWFKWAIGRFACSRPCIEGDLKIDEYGREVGSIGAIAGAGMTFIKKPLIDALDKGYKSYNDTQRGTEMSVTGEDMELCWLMRSMGYKFGYDPKIRLIHSVNPDRLNLKAFQTLCMTIGAGSLGFDPFMFTDFGKKNSIKYTWQWQLASKSTRFLKTYLYKDSKEISRDEILFKTKVIRIELRAAIIRILKERSLYTKHINNISSGSWTELRIC